MKLNKAHWIGLIFGVIILVVSIAWYIYDENYRNIFYFTIGIALIIMALPFILTTMIETKSEKEKNEMFLQFSRDLVDNVRAGTPISKSIVNLRSGNYGSLTPHVKKLANQISIGIPVREGFENFAFDAKSRVISRAVRLIKEAETAGGNIEDILASVAKSVAEIEKLRKERRSAVYSIVVQGYIIFLIFIAIILVMQFKILPLTTELGTATEIGPELGVGGSGASIEDFTTPFLFLLITQGLCAGLVIGKLAEGSLKNGIKHSFFLIVISILFSTGARIFL